MPTDPVALRCETADLAQMGIPAANARDVIELVDKQKPEAIMLLRKAGRVIGEAVSDIVSVLNPAAIVIGGTLARGGDFLLLGIRELIYQRCLPLATRELTIMTVASPKDSAVLGAAASHSTTCSVRRRWTP